MKFLLLTALLASLVLAQQPAADAEQKKIRLEGRVTNTSGEPLRKATVRLQSNAGTPNAPGNTSYSEPVDDEGNFTIEDVRPGSYQLLAERNGYIPQRYGARTIGGTGTVLALTEGTKMTKLVIAMNQQGVIMGRVTDQEGDGVPSIQVRASRYAYVNGQRLLRTEGTGGITDDQGSFRIAGLMPGRYYVLADMRPTANNNLVNPPQPGRVVPATTNVSTYFPNSLDMQGATAFDISVGTESQANIRIRRERVFRARGTVINGATGQPAANALVMVLFPDNVPTMDGISLNNVIANTARADAQGKFDLRNLLPGTHLLRGIVGDTLQIASGNGVMMMAMNQGASAATTQASGSTQVTIPNSDVNDMVFQLSGGGELTGALQFENGTLDDLSKDMPAGPQPGLLPLPGGTPQPPVRLPNIRVAPTSAVAINGPSTTVNADGTFRVTNVSPARYYVTAANLPQGYYVKSMRFGGTDITRTPLDLTQGGTGQLGITLAKGSGEISGTVSNSKGDPLAGITVSVWPKTPDQSSATGNVRIATTDQNGAFKFTNVAPGDYASAAWEDLPEPGLAQYAPFLAGFSGDAATVKLDANGKATAQTKLISREKASAEFAKLP